MLLNVFLTAVSSFSLPSALSPLVGSNIYVRPGAEIRVYHLVRPEGPAGAGGGASGQETTARAVPEVFLTRLLTTKGRPRYRRFALIPSDTCVLPVSPTMFLTFFQQCF